MTINKTGSFLGRVAFVTGAANGIGRAAALAFAREGAGVVVADVSAQHFCARSRQVAHDHESITWSMADGLGELQLLKLARKQSRNHMATKVCFINNATRGIGAQIAKAPLADGNRFAAIDRKSGSRTPRPSDNLHPGAPELARKGQVEMASLLPIIAVAFTVGGPVVYERRGD